MRKLIKHKETLILFFLLILAAFLRLYKIDGYMTFLGDEGRDALIVYNILHGRLTFLGPTASVGGFFLGPIYYYFMVPFFWLFNYNPVGPAVMVALFGIVTVGLVYKVGSEFFDKKAGLLAAALYAISPVVIAYSRSSWNPNLMPFFSLLTLYLLYKAVRGSSWILFILSGIFFGILMQLHYLATFLGVIIAVYVLLTRLAINSGSVLTGVAKVLKEYVYIFLGFLIGFSPFLAFEIRHGFPNIQSIIRFIFQSSDVSTGGNISVIINNVFFRLFGRLITNYPPPEQVSLDHPEIALNYYSTLIMAIFAVSILLVHFYKAVQQRNDRLLKLGLLVTWFFIGLFLFGLYKKSIYDYYLGFMFPLPFLLVGSGLSFLWQKAKIFKLIAAVTFITLFIINIQAMPFRSSPNRQLDQVKEISEFVLSKTDNKPFNFALITGGNSDHGYRFFFEVNKRRPLTIENTQVDPDRRTVTEQLLIVCEDTACQPLGNPLWEVAGFGRAEVVGEWDVSVVKVYKMVHYKGLL